MHLLIKVTIIMVMEYVY